MVDRAQFGSYRRFTPHALLIATVAVASAGRVPAGAGVDDTLDFATQMARAGNWREARYRWESALQKQPDNPRILNNLAVALEALGRTEEAGAAYTRAAALAPGDDGIEGNQQRFARFAQSNPGRDGASDSLKTSGAGKPIKVTVRLPVPPRLDLEGTKTLLVASFRTDENDLLNVNRELVRFLRSEFRKRSQLQVLDVTPPPAIPEQRLEDLVANEGFWKHLGREYGADLIVSGIVTFDRRDHSGFRDVDVISPTTGQKVRQTQFVEQERFSYELDLIFMDGATGAARFQDRLQRSAIYRGTQNDPITAFFDLSESIAADALSIVSPRTREETRVIFRKS